MKRNIDLIFEIIKIVYLYDLSDRDIKDLIALIHAHYGIDIVKEM